MSTINVNVTLEKVADTIIISGGRVTIIGGIREVSRNVTLDAFEVDVTDLLSPARLAEVANLEADAQAWVDNQPFNV